jgi:hypothetical protein
VTRLVQSGDGGGGDTAGTRRWYLWCLCSLHSLLAAPALIHARADTFLPVPVLSRFVRTLPLLDRVCMMYIVSTYMVLILLTFKT